MPSDDWDMWLRLSLGGDLLMLRRFVLGKRGHGENVSSKGRVMAVAEPVVRHKLAVLLPLDQEQRRIARAGHRCSCLAKLFWGRQEIKQGRWLAALKAVYRAGHSYFRYAKRSMCRCERVDLGPAAFDEGVGASFCLAHAPIII